MIFQTKDNMPLLEAVNYSPFMMEKTGQPFFQKEAVETTISGQPAYMSKLRLSVNKPDQFVQNIVIVQRNTFTTVIRSCVGTKEELFYSILKGFKFL
ncbi:hypothetical protein BH09PAT2_BH09PAT2_04120 [soil metagenome]